VPRAYQVIVPVEASSVASDQPTIAAPPLSFVRLAHVTIVDAVDISRVTVQLPVAVAANVCVVDVAILLAAIQDTGTANCTATADSRANNR